MKICETWLREWSNPNVSSTELAAKLTLAGLEVDSVSPVAGNFTKVVVARVLEAKAHPEANKLSLCVVDCGAAEPLQIVCGASNVRTGLKVALALTTATLPNGMVIKETKLRGALSQGMLCSVEELGLQDSSEGILELPDDAPVGVPLREYMQLDGAILDIDLTPNRADCFSVIGIAREASVLYSLPLKPLSFDVIKPVTDETFPVVLDEPKACPRYCGRVISGINPEAVTPMWMQERLRRAGVRPIHAVVDVTNYVMLLLGQPMHAFDRTLLNGAIHVRKSQANETLQLLDEQTVTLRENTLVIADESKVLAIAGIMGGLNSAIRHSSTEIFLESAFFYPESIAGVARSYGLCTESSQRFERGVCPTLQEQALEYATVLLTQIVGGKAGPMVVSEVSADLPPPVTIEFNPSQVQALTGVFVAEQQMEKTLAALGMQVDAQSLPWKISVPRYRFDLHLSVDLVEEIIRIYGYDKIVSSALPSIMQAGSIPEQEQLVHRAQMILSNRGYHEMISYSFVDPDVQKAIYQTDHALSLLNPISPELSQMRQGLLPGLIAALSYNSNRQHECIQLFETGVAFDASSGTVREKTYVSGLLAGKKASLNWSEPTRFFDFFDLKGDLEALFATLQCKDISFKAAVHPGLHPGKCAQIMLGELPMGWIGALHPALVEALDLNGEAFVFEWIVDDCIAGLKKPRYQKISKYPSVRRDLSFLVRKTVYASEIERCVREAMDTPYLKSFDVFDVYAGSGVPADKKSLAIALILQGEDRTLVDDEVNQLMEKVVSKLNQEFEITLRE